MRKQYGFNLVELLITVVIVGILASVAYPAFTGSIAKGRRSDAISTLLNMQLAQEKWRTTHSSYTTTLSDLGYTGTSSEGYYTLSIDSADANSFQMTATAAGSQATADTSCGSFVVTEDGPDTSTSTKKSCWAR